MTDHDRLCDYGKYTRVELDEIGPCLCPIIESARADERTRIVEGIKAMPGEPCTDYEDDSHLIWREDAIDIARGSGADG